ncbi:UNVERIFIED_CONTAM: putative purine permease 4 [Sesamum angustifolium]|uniref:Purine permease 4 n=1 Tax=Sesamum angustifolium TaxID=2727405 RepID=A0AAW2JNM1_9LAMI
MAFPSPPPPPPPSSSEVEENTTASVIINKQESASNSPKTSKNYNLLLAINYAFLFVGSVSSTLIFKFYFIHKGSSRWVSTWVQSAGFPLLLLPVFLPYYLFKCTRRRPFSGFSSKLLLLSMAVGVFWALTTFSFLGETQNNVYEPQLCHTFDSEFSSSRSEFQPRQTPRFNPRQILGGLLLNPRRRVLVRFVSPGNGDDIPESVLLFHGGRDAACDEMAATVFATVGMAADGGFSDMKVESARVFDKARLRTGVLSAGTWFYGSFASWARRGWCS